MVYVNGIIGRFNYYSPGKKTTQGSKLVATPNKTVEIYDLIKKLWMDSTGYSEVGDWAVGNPKNSR